MKYLGIDYGEAKVGLAVGDSESRLALPYKIIANPGWNRLIEAVKEIIRVESIGLVVVGLPLGNQSQSTIQTEKVRSFVDELKKNLAVEVAMHDERLSSKEAQKLGAGKRDDDIAAMILLQSYLDVNL